MPRNREIINVYCFKCKILGNLSHSIENEYRCYIKNILCNI